MDTPEFMAEQHLGPALSTLCSLLAYCAHNVAMLPGLIATFALMGGCICFPCWTSLAVPLLLQRPSPRPGPAGVLRQQQPLAAWPLAPGLCAGAILGQNPFAVVDEHLLDSWQVGPHNESQWPLIVWPCLFVALFFAVTDPLAALMHTALLVAFKRLALGRLPPGEGGGPCIP